MRTWLPVTLAASLQSMLGTVRSLNMITTTPTFRQPLVTLLKSSGRVLLSSDAPMSLVTTLGDNTPSVSTKNQVTGSESSQRMSCLWSNPQHDKYIKLWVINIGFVFLSISVATGI